MAKYDDRGREIPDKTVMDIPLGFRRPPTLEQRIARYVRGQLSREAESQGFETFAEADDFVVDGDLEDLPTKYELSVMQEDEKFLTPDKDASKIDKRRNGPASKEKDNGKEREDRGNEARVRDDLRGSSAGSGKREESDKQREASRD